MILLLDQDGPLADFDRAFWQLCQNNGWPFDVEHPHEQVHRFFTEHLPDRGHRKRARAMVDAAGWFEELPVTPGACEGVDQLLRWACDGGHQVWVCTKPLEVNPTCRDAKAAWLRRHMPELEHRLIITPDKSLVYGDFLLDDAPHPKWLPLASWDPVVFTAPFNGAGSDWAGLPHWSWADGIDHLITLMEADRT